MKVAQAIAEILKREGVEFLIGYPVNPLFDAAAEAGIRTIVVRQERTGVHMADGFSRINSGRRVGVFTMQHGPGAENAFGAVAQAYSESVPILVLPAGYPRAVSQIPPNFNSSITYRPITKWSEQLTMASMVEESMRRGFTQVKNGRPRPVLIEVPLDLFGREMEHPPSYKPVVQSRYGPDPHEVDRAASMIRQAKNPLIVAGQGIHYARCWGELREVVEAIPAPVMTTLEGKSAFPEDHPLSIGCAGRSFPKAVRHFLNKADVILGVGCSFTRTIFGVPIPRGKTVIHATLDPADINKDVEVSCALIGDARLTLKALLEALDADNYTGKEDKRKALEGEIKQVKDIWIREWLPKLTSDEVPLSPYRVIWDLMHTVDTRKTIITHDAGSPRDQISPFWVSTEPLSYIGWGKTTQLGYGLGLAMGAKLAAPEKLCINVMGDAAIGMTGMDLETAVRERIPILTVVLNNFSMAVELPLMPVSTERYGSTNISGNYSELARALGGYSERVTTPEEIIPAIKRAVDKTQEGTPALLEFITQKEIHYSIYRE